MLEKVPGRGLPFCGVGGGYSRELAHATGAVVLVQACPFADLLTCPMVPNQSSHLGPVG